MVGVEMIHLKYKKKYNSHKIKNLKFCFEVII